MLSQMVTDRYTKSLAGKIIPDKNNDRDSKIVTMICVGAQIMSDYDRLM
ncbi:hypothetical protein ECMP0215613_5505 [Escherichia coli MP021561.3]|nr:hypothetical protein ECMP0215613_5505 [Escherichia coli MP021561.3]